MPVNTEKFDNAEDSIEKVEHLLKAAVEATNYMLKREGVEGVNIMYGNGWATYHRKSKGVHKIKYGAQCFILGPESKRQRMYIVKNDEVYQSYARNYDPALYIVSVIIEETAHYFQNIEGGRIYGEMHNASFFKHFKRLWNLYSDEVMGVVSMAIITRK